jgi:putative hemolysin
VTEALPFIVALALLIVGSAFFSGTEVAMFGLRRVDRAQLVRSDRRSDSLIVRLLARPRRLIATILIGNELINVSISATTAGLVGILFAGGSELEMAFIATSVALPLVLFLGEITPKTIAIKTPMPWARGAVQPLMLFYALVTPLRIIVRGIASVILLPFGGDPGKVGPREMSEDEFKALVDVGSAEGALDARERRLIHKVFEFADKTIAQAMQPRRELFALSYELPLARLIREISERGFSRVPIYSGSKDNVIGVLHVKDLVIAGSGLSPKRLLSEMLHEPLFVPPTTPVELMFRIFKQRKTHMALVVNEYGKLIGLVTMEDLLEELFGEIRDERERKKARALANPLETNPVPRIDEREVAGD